MGVDQKARRKKRKVGNPIRASTATCEGGFEAAVGSFNHSIGLGMESSCVDVGNLERVVREDQREEVNWEPQSEVRV